MGHKGDMKQVPFTDPQISSATEQNLVPTATRRLTFAHPSSWELTSAERMGRHFRSTVKIKPSVVKQNAISHCPFHYNFKAGCSCKENFMIKIVHHSRRTTLVTQKKKKKKEGQITTEDNWNRRRSSNNVQIHSLQSPCTPLQAAPVQNKKTYHGGTEVQLDGDERNFTSRPLYL